jgi:hypothetical protein
MNSDFLEEMTQVITGKGIKKILENDEIFLAPAVLLRITQRGGLRKASRFGQDFTAEYAETVTSEQ